VFVFPPRFLFGCWGGGVWGLCVWWVWGGVIFFLCRVFGVWGVLSVGVWLGSWVVGGWPGW
jgi:hypothetical protein